PAQPQTRWRPPQGDVELMAEKQILSFEPASRLEQVGDEHCKQMKDRQHHVELCADSTSWRESARMRFSGMTGALLPLREALRLPALALVHQLGATSEMAPLLSARKIQFFPF